MRPFWLCCVAACWALISVAAEMDLSRADREASAEKKAARRPTRAEGVEEKLSCRCSMTVKLVLGKNEVMTDRCSASVAFPPTYDGKPDAPGTVHLVRDKTGRTPWTPPFTVKLSSGGHIRWWCNSTKGNIFDPGTWRVQSATVGAKFDDTGKAKPTVSIKIVDSSWKGWTAERSRCKNRSTRIRARLGPDRLLQIECLGK